MYQAIFLKIIIKTNDNKSFVYVSAVFLHSLPQKHRSFQILFVLYSVTNTNDMKKKDFQLNLCEILNNNIFEQTVTLKQAKQDPESNLQVVQNRYVECIAKLYENQGLSHDELISAGNKGLLKAAENYHPNKKFKFAAYAVWWIRHYILQAIQEKKH